MNGKKKAKSRYPGIGYIGNKRISGLYGMAGGIVDAKGTGLQHLFYETYEHDLIHTGCTIVKMGERLYYGNKKESREGHQEHQCPTQSEALGGYLYHDHFEIEEGKIGKSDYTAALDDNKILFKTVIENRSGKCQEVTFYSFININPFEHIHARVSRDENSAELLGCRIRMMADDTREGMLIKDAPTGFLYRTTQALLYKEEKVRDLEVKGLSLSMLREKQVTIEPGASAEFSWVLVVASQEEEYQKLNRSAGEGFEIAAKQWEAWFAKGGLDTLKVKDHYDCAKANLAAIRASLLNGFVPADLTGHYYANGMPCYYARDAMMIARGFLAAGYLEEFKEIMAYLITRQRKESGEFYQRYNGVGIPDEGANNNIFHQLDSIGFFLYNIRKYYDLSGEMLISYEGMKALFSVLENSEEKRGLIGIEGGVNEGVYGGAYITSSNAFIYGGIRALKIFATEANDLEMIKRCNRLMERIQAGIEATYISEEERYCYGFVDYSDQLVTKYDTPLYFGILYGWEDGLKMRNTHSYYQKAASFFGEGVGYSEQEYHHGPWLFNTMAAAQYCWLKDDVDGYKAKLDWAKDHANAYGLMPEAIDAEDEDHCFINPLTWACSEYISAIFIHNPVLVLR